MVTTVKDYEKLSEQYNKMLEERNSLIDDLSWYRAKVSRLERENEEFKEKQVWDIEHILKVNDENRQLKDDLWCTEGELAIADKEIERLTNVVRKLNLDSDDYKYTTLTDHIRLKAENNPGVSRYIDLVNYIDRLERGEDG